MDICTDVLIVGTGVAGLFSALNIEDDKKVIIISKTKSDECNTYLAQGGISKAKNKDDTESFIQDTLKAGRHKNKKEAVEVLAKESIKNIDLLLSFGMKFDYRGEEFDYTREGGHSINRIVHSTDETGKMVFETLYREVKKRKNISIIEDCILVDILKDDESCHGGIVIKNGGVSLIHAKYTILASGGIGGLFTNSTNRRTSTGDGIAIAIRNNVELENLEYIQFHPTALYEDKNRERRFLISESLRGEGAKLKNVNGEAFTDELLPRDVVSNNIWREQLRTGTDFVYLDISEMGEQFLKNRFPGIYKGCLARGLNLKDGVIPVTPVQHYFMGGIKVDLNSKTSMDSLYACGEVSCTGVHGANRLASNSLLEGLVFSRRAAIDINSRIDDKQLKILKKDITIEKALQLKEENLSCALEQFKKVLGEKEHELINNR